MSLRKKCLKLTNAGQFTTLVEEIQKRPEIARGASVLGTNRSKYEVEWEQIAEKLNNLGPPTRKTSEWRKIWADLKARVKRKMPDSSIADLKIEGGRVYNRNTLSALEHSVCQILKINAIKAQAFAQSKLLGDKDNSMNISTSKDFTTEKFSPEFESETVDDYPQDSLMDELLGEPDDEYGHSTTVPSTVCLKQLPNKTNFQEESLFLLRRQIKNQAKILDVLGEISTSLKRQATAAERSATCAEKRVRISEFLYSGITPNTADPLQDL